jgi:hypothetical protein
MLSMIFNFYRMQGNDGFDDEFAVLVCGRYQTICCYTLAQAPHLFPYALA